MNNSEYRFTLDIQETQSQVSIPVNLGDTARTLYISLTDGGVPYTIASGCWAQFSARKSDDNFLNTPCAIEKNVIVYEFTEQTASAEGLVYCEINLYGSDAVRIASPKFILVVDNRVVYDAKKIYSASERTSIDEILGDGVTLAAVRDRVTDLEDGAVKLSTEGNGTVTVKSFSDKKIGDISIVKNEDDGTITFKLTTGEANEICQVKLEDLLKYLWKTSIDESEVPPTTKAIKQYVDNADVGISGAAIGLPTYNDSTGVLKFNTIDGDENKVVEVDLPIDSMFKSIILNDDGDKIIFTLWDDKVWEVEVSRLLNPTWVKDLSNIPTGSEGVPPTAEAAKSYVDNATDTVKNAITNRVNTFENTVENHVNTFENTITKRVETLETEVYGKYVTKEIQSTEYAVQFDNPLPSAVLLSVRPSGMVNFGRSYVSYLNGRAITDKETSAFSADRAYILVSSTTPDFEDDVMLIINVVVNWTDLYVFEIPYALKNPFKLTGIQKCQCYIDGVPFETDNPFYQNPEMLSNIISAYGLVSKPNMYVLQDYTTYEENGQTYYENHFLRYIRIGYLLDLDEGYTDRNVHVSRADDAFILPTGTKYYGRFPVEMSMGLSVTVSADGGGKVDTFDISRVVDGSTASVIGGRKNLDTNVVLGGDATHLGVCVKPYGAELSEDIIVSNLRVKVGLDDISNAPRVVKVTQEIKIPDQIHDKYKTELADTRTYFDLTEKAFYIPSGNKFTRIDLSSYFPTDISHIKLDKDMVIGFYDDNNNPIYAYMNMVYMEKVGD